MENRIVWSRCDLFIDLFSILVSGRLLKLVKTGFDKLVLINVRRTPS